MAFETYLAFQNNSIARMVVWARHLLVGFKFAKAASIGMPLQRELAGVIIFPVLQGKVTTCKAEETLKTFTFYRNIALSLRL